MRRPAWLLAVALLGGCSWSNSLYHARRLSNAAERAERENRSFEAGGFWGQVITKADSAYARNPDGTRGAEALWLRGRALARTSQCGEAVGSLERAVILAPTAAWRDEALLDLGRCRGRLGDPRAADDLRPLLNSADSGVRVEARRGAGRALISSEQWAEALDVLEGVPGASARIDRGIAMAAVGRTDDAIAELEPLLAAADTTVAWDRILGYMANRDAADAETIFSRLMRFPNLTPPLEARWRLAMVRGTALPDSAQSRHLNAAVRLTGSAAAGDARVLLAERRLAGVETPEGLTEVVDGFDALTEGEVSSAITLQRYLKLADALVEDADTVRAGAALGDLAFFHQAEIARDSLHAPRLASWFFRRIEADWSASPYLPKVLLARVLLEPDSAAALRARLAAFAESPYLRYLRGDVTSMFRALEDSLGFYLGDRAAAAATRQMRNTVPTEFE